MPMGNITFTYVHALGAGADGTQVYLADGSKQVANSSGQVTFNGSGTGQANLAALIAQGWQFVSAS